MFARIVGGQTVTGKLSQAVKTWKEKDSLLKRPLKGYRGGYFLTDPQTGKILSLTFWDSEKDAVAYDQGPVYKQIVALYKGVLTVEYTQFLEIAAQDKI